FWIGETGAVVGDQVTLLALPGVAVRILHADPTQMGLLTAIGLLPHLLFSLPAGVWLDRVRVRRRLMILCDIGRALTIAVIPAAFVLHWLGLELLFVVAFVVGSLSVVFDISWNTLFVSVAKRDQYVEATALLNGSRSLASVAGPAISGILIQLFRAPIALMADALSYLGSVVFLRRITAPEPPIEHEPGTIRQQLRAGLAFIFGDPIIRPTILSAAPLNLFNYCFQAPFIPYPTLYLRSDPGARERRIPVHQHGHPTDRCDDRRHPGWADRRARDAVHRDRAAARRGALAVRDARRRPARDARAGGPRLVRRRPGGGALAG